MGTGAAARAPHSADLVALRDLGSVLDAVGVEVHVLGAPAVAVVDHDVLARAALLVVPGGGVGCRGEDG
ncbi:hypothetical protein OGH68_14300 [Streptomyces peucetius]|uniref:DJ-1/PfpI domain-containing protein n=1 Tax=Streptomyces peucetius TaxID=1950 RepID=A0ABY6I9K3_STRPE|nr:hypothetical protein [Streptomyces peucetius]UYQ62537.1 hypothetical protein OGH68_14300 [Streptomyces peucetius]